MSTLRLYQLSPDFRTAPPTATLNMTTLDIGIAPFTEACNGGVCIPQPNNQRLDSLGDRLMYRLGYRVFSSDHNAMVVNHSGAAGSSVGVRWYELRQPSAGAAFSLFQQGTFAPDSASRWMGSAAMDGAGNIAIGYSKSSSTIYPSLAFAGRMPSMTAGTMGMESLLKAGSGAQTTYSRWGNYSVYASIRTTTRRSGTRTSITAKTACSLTSTGARSLPRSRSLAGAAAGHRTSASRLRPIH